MFDSALSNYFIVTNMHIDSERYDIFLFMMFVISDAFLCYNLYAFIS
jgi:hypothetical protein